MADKRRWTHFAVGLGTWAAIVGTVSLTVWLGANHPGIALGGMALGVAIASAPHIGESVCRAWRNRQ